MHDLGGKRRQGFEWTEQIQSVGMGISHDLGSVRRHGDHPVLRGHQYFTGNSHTACYSSHYVAHRIPIGDKCPKTDYPVSHKSCYV